MICNVDIYFFVATRGLFSYDPAQSCKEIKDLGISNGDGEYWIDPGRTKSPLKAYCDMTTDGGRVLLEADTSFMLVRLIANEASERRRSDSEAAAE